MKKPGGWEVEKQREKARPGRQWRRGKLGLGEPAGNPGGGGGRGRKVGLGELAGKLGGSGSGRGGERNPGGNGGSRG